MAHVMGDGSLTDLDRRIAFFLADHVNIASGIAWPSAGRLAGCAGVTERATRRSLGRLVNRGYFDLTRRGGGARSNTYKPRQPLTGESPLTDQAPLTGESATPDRWSPLPLTDGSPEPIEEPIDEPVEKRRGTHPRPAEPDEIQFAFQDWNELAERCSLPTWQRITDARRRKMRARLHDAGGIQGWRHALAKVEGSSFLRGENGRGWRPDIDFMLSEAKFTKIMEGAYDNGSGAGSNGSGRAAKSELMEAFGRMPDPPATAHR